MPANFAHGGAMKGEPGEDWRAIAVAIARRAGGLAPPEVITVDPESTSGSLGLAAATYSLASEIEPTLRMLNDAVRHDPEMVADAYQVLESHESPT